MLKFRAFQKIQNYRKDLTLWQKFAVIAHSSQLTAHSLSCGLLTGKLRLLALLLAFTFLSFSFGTSWAGDVTFTSITGTGTEAAPYVISSAEGLKELATKVNTETDASDFSEKYFKLVPANEATTLDLASETELTPIGLTEEKSFKGIFDGNGKTIKGLKLTYQADADANDAVTAYYGLFGYIGTGGKVENLTLEAPSLTSEAGVKVGEQTLILHMGAVAGYNAGTIENCYVTAGTVSDTAELRESETAAHVLGGIAGSNAGTITKCLSFIRPNANTGENKSVVAHKSAIATNTSEATEGSTTPAITDCYYQTEDGDEDEDGKTGVTKVYAIVLPDDGKVTASATKDSANTGIAYGGNYYAPAKATVTLAGATVEGGYFPYTVEGTDKDNPIKVYSDCTFTMPDDGNVTVAAPTSEANGTAITYTIAYKDGDDDATFPDTATPEGATHPSEYTVASEQITLANLADKDTEPKKFSGWTLKVDGENKTVDKDGSGNTIIPESRQAQQAIVCTQQSSRTKALATLTPSG